MNKTHGYLGGWNQEGEYQAVQRKMPVNKSTLVSYISLNTGRNVAGCTCWFSEHTAQFSVEVQLSLLRTGLL